MKRLAVQDIARQGITVIAAILQIVCGQISPVAEVETANSTRIQPADYAFTIWAPIFLLSLVYAIYQVLPANRQSPLLRRVGWFAAGAFLLNSLWELLIRQFVLNQVFIVALLACIGAAYFLTVQAARRGELSNTERWVVALPFGLFFGWITAATFVGLGGTLVSVGLLSRGDMTVSTALLLVCGLLAIGAVVSGRAGPRVGYLAYAAAVAWALVGIIVSQYTASTLVTVTAAAVAILIAATVIANLLKSQPPHSGRQALSA